MIRKPARLLFIAAAALLLAAGCTFQVSDEDASKQLDKFQKAAVKVEPAPKFSGELMDGKKVDLSDYRGKPLVLNFWASWCPPCRAEQPEFVNISNEYKGKVVFLGMNFRDSKAPAKKFLKDYKVPYESIYDPSGRIGFKYRVKALPATFFISSDGKVIDRKIGGIQKDEIVKGVKKLIEDDAKKKS